MLHDVARTVARELYDKIGEFFICRFPLRLVRGQIIGTVPNVNGVLSAEQFVQAVAIERFAPIVYRFVQTCLHNNIVYLVGSACHRQLQRGDYGNGLGRIKIFRLSGSQFIS